VFLAAAVILGVPYALFKLAEKRDEAELQEQLSAARAEGLPTNGKEMAALIQSAKPEENAGPIYQKLRGAFRNSGDVIQLTLDIEFNPNPTLKKRAHELLTKYAVPIALTEKAAKLPRCWFDRNWDLGAAVLFPEFATMKTAARFLGLRAALEASEGRVDSILADIDRMVAISKQAHEEPTAIAHLVSESIRRMAIGELARASFVYRNRPEYAREMARILKGWQKPNLKEEQIGELYNVLSLIELCSTPKGRENLGLKTEDIPAAESFFPIFMNRKQALVEIIKAQRAYWKALDAPQKERKSRIDAANDEFSRAMLAFPTAAKIYDMLSYGGEDPMIWRAEISESARLQYVVLQRALAQRVIPKKISTDDLLSPFDGKPVRYSFDGKQIVIEVSGYERDSKPVQLKVPPDSVFKKP
jgi:hypothetical protein